MSHCLWFPFNFPPGYQLKDLPFECNVGGNAARVFDHGGSHILEVRGLRSEGAARDLVPHVKNALLWAALNQNRGLQLPTEIDEPVYYEDPKQAAKNLGFPDSVVDGVFEGAKICVYPESLKLKRLYAGNVGFLQEAPPAKFVQAIDQGVRLLQAAPGPMSDNLCTAIEMFCLSDFKTSTHVRFLTLCTALEVAAPRGKKLPHIIDTIEKWKREAKDLSRKNKQTSAKPHVGYSELSDQLERFKDESHRQAVYRFVSEVLAYDGHDQALDIAKEARNLWDKRGRITHEGKLHLAKDTPRLKEIVGIALIAAIRQESKSQNRVGSS